MCFVEHANTWNTNKTAWKQVKELQTKITNIIQTVIKLQIQMYKTAAHTHVNG